MERYRSTPMLTCREASGLEAVARVVADHGRIGRVQRTVSVDVSAEVAGAKWLAGVAAREIRVGDMDSAVAIHVTDEETDSHVIRFAERVTVRNAVRRD